VPDPARGAISGDGSPLAVELDVVVVVPARVDEVVLGAVELAVGLDETVRTARIGDVAADDDGFSTAV
jgi:hypothetical protein